MRKKLQLSAVLLAWLLATGSHWDLVQSFAWGRMIAAYSQTMPLREAIRLTFTPDNMCGVCEAVSAAHKQRAETTLPAAGKMDTKVLLLFQSNPEPVFTSPPASPWSLCDLDTPDSRRAAPPLPPPRTFEA